MVLSFSRPVRQQALLAAISEKDANIALLELSSSKRKKAQEEVMALKREKDRLMHQLKQQVNPPYLTTKIFVFAFRSHFTTDSGIATQSRATNSNLLQIMIVYIKDTSWEEFRVLKLGTDRC